MNFVGSSFLYERRFYKVIISSKSTLFNFSSPFGIVNKLRTNTLSYPNHFTLLNFNTLIHRKTLQGAVSDTILSNQPNQA